MKTRKRKGFTLVELLVVIAILAILATVSILGYTSFTKKAKISNDESLVLQLNTALQGEEIIDGKPATAHAAVLLLYEQGIKFDELKLQTDGYHLVYDIENNRFGIIDNNNKASYQDASKKLSSDKIDLFVFVNNGDTLDSFAGYSVYLAKDFVPTNATLSTAAGFDAGYNTSITKVTIANANDVDIVVRTNGGDLVIAVPAGDVNVYGVADKITVQKSATASTHICDAVVSELVVNTDDANDHVEVESGAMVAIVKAEKGDVTVESGASIFYLESTGATVEIKNSSDVAKCYDSASKVTGFTGTKETAKVEVSTSCAHAETKTHTVNGTKCTVCTACGKVTATETTKGEEAAEKTDPVNPTPSDPTPTVESKLLKFTVVQLYDHDDDEDTPEIAKITPKFKSGTWSYSTDGGKTWQEGENNGTEITLYKVGDYVLLKGTNCVTAIYDDNDIMYTQFEMEGYFAASGDVTSLTNGEGGDVALTDCCYAYMFGACDYWLTTAPNLPSTTLAKDCYNNMFSGCSGITKAPTLPATKLATWCYFEMFSQCKALKVTNVKPSGTEGTDWGVIFTCPSAENGYTKVENAFPTKDMFSITGGDFKSSPEAGSTYYWYVSGVE